MRYFKKPSYHAVYITDDDVTSGKWSNNEPRIPPRGLSQHSRERLTGIRAPSKIEAADGEIWIELTYEEFFLEML